MLQRSTRPIDDTIPLVDVDIDHARDKFLVQLIEQMSDTLEAVLGDDEAAGFISLVGNKIGKSINETYGKALQQVPFTLPLVAEILIDLKRRIGGDFTIVSLDKNAIVLRNSHCPFGDHVKGHEPLCMMTSNVFGRVVADNLGYAKVELQETIAQGDSQCLVKVQLDPSALSNDGDAREYFSSIK